MDHPGEHSLRHLYFTAERKDLHLDLCENERGVFLRITETAGGRRNSVIIPAAGLGPLHKAVGNMVALLGGAASDT